MSVAAPSLPRARDDGLAQRVARCFSVSVLTTTISLAALGVLTAGFGVVAWLANVVATALGTLVSYRLNRQWVWRRRDASDPWREIVPFWAMSFAGLVLSTVLVAGADLWASAAHLDRGLHTAAVLAASVSGYAALWIAEFVVLDRVLFAAKSPACAAGGPNPPHQEPSL
jgi:putative flippase GtrA